MSNKKDFVAIVGVPGVGKTSLCREVSKNIEHPHINYGDLMLEIAREQNLAENEEELFSLSIQTQYDIWREAALRIRKRDKALIDLHGLDQSSIGYILSVPFEIIKPSFIIIIESQPELILFRRKLDKKKRIKDNIKSLIEHMEMLRILIVILSTFIGCKFSIIQNVNFKEAADEIKHLLALHEKETKI